MIISVSGEGREKRILKSVEISIFKDLWIFWAFVFVFGAILGSFFNCLIYRLPNDLSIVRPRSFCPSCKKTIAGYDNIPLLSYLLLRGRCRHCGNGISLRYFGVELLTACMALPLAYWLISEPRMAWEWIWALYAAGFLLLLIPITWIDLDHRIIPDIFTLPTIGLGLAASFLPGGISPLSALLGLLAGGGTLYLIGWVGTVALRKGEAMGGGDVKLMAAAGTILGAKAALLSLFLGSVLGSIAGVSILAIKGWKSDHRIAFGPYLAVGILLAFFGTDLILDLYGRLVLRLAEFLLR